MALPLPTTAPPPEPPPSALDTPAAAASPSAALRLRQLPTATREALLRASFLAELAEAGLNPRDPTLATRLSDARERRAAESAATELLATADLQLRAGDLRAASATLKRAGALEIDEDLLKPYNTRLWLRRLEIAVVESSRVAAPLAVPLLPLLGAWLVVRRHRSRAPSPGFNPYLVGRPVRDRDALYGREDLVSGLFDALRAGQSVALCGERRIGKTSLLLQLGQRWREAGGLEIYIDLEGSSNRGPLGAVHDALARVANQLGLDALGPPAALAHRLALTHGPVLLALDEADAFGAASAEDLAALDATRGAAGAGLVLALAGVELSLLDPARPGALASVVEWSVPPLDALAARRLLLDPVAGRVRYDEAVVEEVVVRSQGRPMRVQLFGLHLVDHLGHRGRSSATLADLRAVVGEVERAWAAIQEAGLAEQRAPLELDAARYEVARLRQEVLLLAHALGEPPP